VGSTEARLCSMQVLRKALASFACLRSRRARFPSLLRARAKLCPPFFRAALTS